jgi:putative membrane protein
MSTGSAARDAHEGDAEGDEIDIEPDYRFTLANERTFLAWNRTSLGLIAGGVAVLQLVPEFGPTGSRHIVGALLAILGIVVSLASLRRWALVQRAMRRDADLPPSRLPLVLTGGLIVVTLAVVALVLAAR